MGLNIKNPEVEKLAAEVARMAGETKTEAVRQSLLLRMEKLRTDPPEVRKARLLKYLKEEVWPRIPPAYRGKPITKADREEILGIGEQGWPE